MSATKPKVLIAEDNPALARMLSFKFESTGFESVTCANGKLAWECFQNEPVDAVISDHEMPYMTGIQLCRKIREIDDDIPFFLVTGRQLEIVASGASDGLKITNIFAKPFSPASVRSAVSEAIDSAMGGTSA